MKPEGHPRDANEDATPDGRAEPAGRPDERGDPAGRPINPLAALTLVVLFPSQTFARLKLRPNWIAPILFVVAAVVAKSLLSLSGGVLDAALQGEAMRTGVDIELVRAGAPVAFIASGVIGVPVVILLQALFLKAVGRLFGGYASFKVCLSTIAYASVPVGIGALAAAALIPLTHSADIGADLSRFVDPAAHPFLWGAARELGVVPLWFYLLVGVAVPPVLGLAKRKGRLAALAFAVVHITIMSWLGMPEARAQGDALQNWHEVTTEHAVLHFPEGVGRTVIDGAEEATVRAGARVSELVGRMGERIDCYVYPSVGEKERVTGNGALAHGVSWANAVHVAWEGSAETALTREMAKVAGARVLGKMYNPFISDGLAVYAGAYWGGRPVVEVAGELHGAGSLPPLRCLIDPQQYAVVERHIGEVAAGAFASYLIEELGQDSYLDVYSYVSRTGAPLEGVLSRALGDSLSAIEDGWLEYVSGAAGAGPAASTD
ncbi:MAG: Yip1 family protein [Candidatus Eisenbacteria bacterium]